MIAIETLPDLPWTEQSAAEIAKAPGLVEDSDFAWQVDDLFVAGWHYPVLAGPPWFWFALTENFERKDVRRLLILRPKIPAGAFTAVQRDFVAGHRFAKYFGFQPTGDVVEGDYLVYRRA